MKPSKAELLTRPIVGIENRTAQEVFDIMCDRFKALPDEPSPSPASDDHIAGVGKMIAPSPTKPEGLEWSLSEDQYNGVREMIRKAYIAGCNAVDMEFGPEDQEPEDFEEPSYEYTTSVTDDFIKMFPSVRLFPVSDATDTVTLSQREANLCRQWFDAVQDLNDAYLFTEDAVLAVRLYRHLGIAPSKYLLKCASLNGGADV